MPRLPHTTRWTVVIRSIVYGPAFSRIWQRNDGNGTKVITKRTVSTGVVIHGIVIYRSAFSRIWQWGYRNIFFVCLSCFYHGNGFRSRIQLGIHKNLTEKYFPYKIFLDRKIGAERFRKNMYSVGSTVI